MAFKAKMQEIYSKAKTAFANYVAKNSSGYVPKSELREAQDAFSGLENQLKISKLNEKATTEAYNNAIQENSKYVEQRDGARAEANKLKVERFGTSRVMNNLANLVEQNKHLINQQRQKIADQQEVVKAHLEKLYGPYGQMASTPMVVANSSGEIFYRSDAAQKLLTGGTKGIDVSNYVEGEKTEVEFNGIPLYATLSTVGDHFFVMVEGREIQKKPLVKRPRREIAKSLKTIKANFNQTMKQVTNRHEQSNS